MICSKGHQYRGDENYRARTGKCPVCNLAALKRYRESPGGRESRARYGKSAKGLATKRAANARTNARRIRAGDLYLGMCGFSVIETEAMLNGSSD